VYELSFKQTQRTFSLLLYLDCSALHPLDTRGNINITNFLLPSRHLDSGLPNSLCMQFTFLLSKKN